MYCNIYTSASFIQLFVILSTIAVVPLASHQTFHNNDVIESSSFTEFKVTRFRYTWTIKNFSIYSKTFGKLDEALSSPIFKDGTGNDCPWQLEIFPHQPNNSNYYVSLSLLYLYPYNCNQYNGQYRLGIVNAKRDEINIVNDTFHFYHTYEKFNISHNQFIEQHVLLNEDNGLLPDDKLTIFCEIKIPSDESTLEITKRDLNNDLRVLLKNQEFSDVSLFAQGIEFKSFKAILSARSLVFREMFERDANIIKVQITDVDPNVMSEVLRYVYTDEVTNLEYVAHHLLFAAEKYKLNGLKTIAENSISQQLTVQNAAEFYILGDTYSSERLKTKVKEFVASHKTGVSHSKGFGEMLKTHPKLLLELFSVL